MAKSTLKGDTLTLADIANRFKGKYLGYIVRTLAQMNSVLPHMRFTQCETATEYEYNYQTSLPEGSWINANEGSLPEVDGVTKQVERPGILIMRSRVNDELVRQAGSAGQMMLSQMDVSFLQSMQIQGAKTFYYGSKATDVRQFDGISNILASKSRPNVTSAGGSGSDLTSAYIVCWDKLNACTMFYPEGSQYGIEVIPLPYQTVVDPTTHEDMEVYRKKFRLAWGFAIQDHRCAARYGDLETKGSSNTFNPDVLVDILSYLWSKQNVHMYCNRKLYAAISKVALNKENAYFRQDEKTGNIFGGPVNNFQNQLPIHVDDAILGTETALQS